MRRVVGDCFDRYRVTGMYMVNVDAAASGALENVCVDGGGDPTLSACIEESVRTYPFILR